LDDDDDDEADDDGGDETMGELSGTVVLPSTSIPPDSGISNIGIASSADEAVADELISTSVGIGEDERFDKAAPIKEADRVDDDEPAEKK
jgi:hypothetical protein